MRLGVAAAGKRGLVDSEGAFLSYGCSSIVGNTATTLLTTVRSKKKSFLSKFRWPCSKCGNSHMRSRRSPHTRLGHKSRETSRRSCYVVHGSTECRWVLGNYNVPHVTLLAPRILRWLLAVRKICAYLGLIFIYRSTNYCLFNKTQNNTSYWRTFRIKVTALNQTYILREAHTRVLQVDIINIGVYTIPLSLGWRESYSQISIFAIVTVMRLLRWATQHEHFPVIVCRWS